MPEILTQAEVLQFRRRLCDLALKAFAEQGVESMSLRGLAAAVALHPTATSITADILAAVRQSEFQRMADEAEQVTRSESDPDKRLVALARSYLNFAMETPDAYRVMYSVNQHDEQRYTELVKQINRTQQPMITAVREAIEKGTIHGDPINIVHVLWAGLHGIISLYLSDKLHMGRDIGELAEVMIRSLSRAIANTPSAQPATRRILERP